MAIQLGRCVACKREMDTTAGSCSHCGSARGVEIFVPEKTEPCENCNGFGRLVKYPMYTDRPQFGMGFDEKYFICFSKPMPPGLAYEDATDEDALKRKGITYAVYGTRVVDTGACKQCENGKWVPYNE